MTTETNARAVRWLLAGRVQGVGFRYFARQAARELGATGRVRNLPGGEVEVEAAGEPEALDRLRERLRQGAARRAGGAPIRAGADGGPALGPLRDRPLAARSDRGAANVQ